MKRISSNNTYFFKKIFPVIWYGLTTFFLLVSVISSIISGKISFVGIIMPLLFLAIGYFSFKHSIFDLADEAWDAGDSIIIKKKDIEVSISLSNIRDVNYMANRQPSVTLTLNEPCQLGRKISFFLPKDWNPFKEHPWVTDLIRRIGLAKKG